MQLPRSFQIILVSILIIWFGYQSVVDIVVDLWWFEGVGFETIFYTKLKTQVGLWVVTFLSSCAFIWGNLYYLGKGRSIDIKELQRQFSDFTIPIGQFQNIIRFVKAAVIILPSLLLASVAAQNWLSVLSFLDMEPFGALDPVFGYDIGFYVFQLPTLAFVQGILTTLIFICSIVVVGSIVVREGLLSGRLHQLSPQATRQILFLGGLLFLSFGADWYLERFYTLFTKEGVVWGAGYADVNARIPAYMVMAGISALVSLACFFGMKNKNLGMLVSGGVIYIAARLLMTGAWPSLVQDFMVTPNELDYELEYLNYNIESTRDAYALERIDVRPFEATTQITMENITQNPLTIENVRLWDSRPLLTTYGQLQEIRTYYDFVDVDVDRYIIDGKLRQVMLSARELNYNSVSPQAKSWVNEHFQYTHGYGLTLSPVNVVTKEGLPDLFVKDLPPSSVPGLEVTQPEIYYGEMTNSYVVVGGSVEEFDYPEGDQNVTTSYSGKGGVSIGGFVRKFMFSLYMKEFDILLSQYITDDAKLLFRRSVRERLNTLAPFLYFDKDPYLVLSEGRLFWIVDAYTVSDRYPYSEPVQTRPGYNYIRNSVKIVVDAYHGEVNFYISDKKDPIIKVYEKVFEGVFQPLEEMPASLQEHLRYPVDFFDIQARMYQSYHMTNSTVFYNKEDMWELPREKYDSDEQIMQSYYLIMKLPESDEAEFVLLRPFVPTGKDNMISWLAARSDGDNYGRLILYQFPKQKLIYGPRQIEARIDQDTEISQQLTLWSQSGSRVVRGNLLVIPIDESLIYVEPLYLKSESSQLPELKRVIVSYNNNIAMKETLAESLATVFGASDKIQEDLKLLSEGTPELSNEASNQTTAQSWQELAQTAVQVLSEAEQYQKDGKWAEYGESLQELSNVLSSLEALSGIERVEPTETVLPDVETDTEILGTENPTPVVE
jgi:uncharacterized protein